MTGMFLACIWGFVVAPGLSWASMVEGDLVREARLRDEIVDMIFDGEPLMLQAGEREFLSILTEAEDAQIGVIILHGRGFHPDWQETVNPLRVGLADHGWTTLSLQMPVLEKSATYYDYVPVFDAAIPRIDAGVAELRRRGLEHVVLIAHSCGAHMAMHWVDAGKGGAIDGYVGLGMGATDYRQYMAKPFPLERFTGPVLDVYGENDFPAVIKMAPERLSLIEQAGNAQSQQMLLPGADHYYAKSGAALVELVHRWLASIRF
ncbi:MAG TPA: hypothetical protein DD979_08425 [Gammaproteobacteria bacterium]|nr:hypothetical protein [Gammaproteobacteria bacterium]